MTDVREIVARAVKPEWWLPAFPVDEAGQKTWAHPERHALDNFPGQYAKYREQSLNTADSILSALDAAGYVVVPKSSVDVPIEMGRGSGKGILKPRPQRM